MSGINPDHNKFESCEGCPHREIEPVNCHTVCRVNLYREKKRQQELKEKKDRHKKESDYNYVRKSPYYRYK